MPAIIKTFEADGSAERIRNTLSDVYVLEGKELSISVSIGISIYPEDSLDIDILINKADVTMYNAKEHGGNNYKFFISE